MNFKSIVIDKDWMADRNIKYNLMLWGLSVASFRMNKNIPEYSFSKKILNYTNIEEYISTDYAGERDCTQRTGSRPTLRKAAEELFNIGYWIDDGDRIIIAPMKLGYVQLTDPQIDTIIQSLKEEETKILLWLTQMNKFAKQEKHVNFRFTKRQGIRRLGLKEGSHSLLKIQQIYNSLQELGFIKFIMVKEKYKGYWVDLYELQNVDLDADPLELHYHDSIMPSMDDLLFDIFGK